MEAATLAVGERIYGVIKSLHFADFGGWSMKWLYFISGLLGMLMMAVTGSIIAYWGAQLFWRLRVSAKWRRLRRERRLRAAELADMVALARDALSAGAVGVSTDRN